MNNISRLSRRITPGVFLTVFSRGGSSGFLFIWILFGILGCTPTERQKPKLAPAAAGLSTPSATEQAPATVVTTPVPSPDAHPRPAAPSIDTRLPTIFIAGDSTAAHGVGEAQQGWAVPFVDYFDPAKVNVINRARGGRSSRTFITEGLWDQLLAGVKPGDIVPIQFGHNDAGAINDTTRARGSLRGLGEETEEIDNLLTKKHEVVHTFGWYMRKMIADTKARNATPIVLSLTVRNIWKDGKIERGSGRYSQWSQEIAKATHTQFVDVTTLIADKFDAMGEPAVKALYPRDHTHFNATGADLHAAAIVSGLKALPGNPVRTLLSTKGETAQSGLMWKPSLERVGSLGKP